MPKQSPLERIAARNPEFRRKLLEADDSDFASIDAELNEPVHVSGGSNGSLREYCAGVSDAWLVRAGVKSMGSADLHPAARDLFRHDYGKACQTIDRMQGRAGDPDNISRSVGDAFIRAAQSSSDFVNTLRATAHKALLLGFDNTEEDLRWTGTRLVPDFRDVDLGGLGEAPTPTEVPEQQEYMHVHLDDRRETSAIKTYGQVDSISRQAILGADMQFVRRFAKHGRACCRAQADAAWGVLIGNPLMSDGNNLFSAQHSNIGTGGAPSVTTLDEARVLMGTQTSNGVVTNARIKYMLVPRGLEGTACTLRNSQYQPGTGSAFGSYEVISDARLDGASSTAWYATADPLLHDTVVILLLEAAPEPMLEQVDLITIDGLNLKARFDFAALPAEYASLVFNAGA